MNSSRMHRPLITILSLCLATAATAEIAAWKIDLNSLGKPYQEGAPKLTPCETPPEASVFFRKGDELRIFDRKQIDRYLGTQPPVKWAVWNKTTGQLVTHSDRNGFMQLLHRMPLIGPAWVRTTMSCYQVEDPTKEPSPDAKPLLESTLICQSGEPDGIENKQEGGSVEFDADTIANENGTQVHVRFSLNLKPTGLHPLELRTDYVARSGERMWVARDHDGVSGLDICVTSHVELADGSPFQSRIQIEKNGKAVSMDEPAKQRLHSLPIEGDHQLVKKIFYRIYILQIYFESINEGRNDHPWMDDFAMEIPQAVLDRVPKTRVPKPLQGWFPNPVWDLNNAFKKAGIALGENDFAAYDPLTYQVFIFTDQAERIDQFEQLFMTLGPDPPVTHILNLDYAGSNRLINLSGSKASLLRHNGKDLEKPLRSVEFEPITGVYADKHTNLRLVIEENRGLDESLLSNGAYTTIVDQWTEVFETEGPEGKQTGRIKLERIDNGHF